MKLVIMRGPSGSGKSTLARTLGQAFSADDYYEPPNPGNVPGKDYKGSWAPEKLEAAHGWNCDRLLQAMKEGAEVVVYDNTNLYPNPNLRRMARVAVALGRSVEIVEPSSRVWQELRRFLASKDDPEGYYKAMRHVLTGTIELTGRTTHGVPLSSLLRQVLSYVPYTTEDLCR